MRYEVMEMHLFEADAADAKALCGADTSDEMWSVSGYLEYSVYGLSVGNVCPACKALAVPLAEDMIEDIVENLEAEGRRDTAEDYRKLAHRLARETS